MPDDTKNKIKSVVSQVVLFYRVKDWYYHLGLNLLGVIFITGRQFSYPGIFFALIISSCYLAHGYSFNALCDKDPVKWSLAEYVGAFFPLAIGIFLIFPRYSFLGFTFLAAVALNILYSHPSIGWKKMAVVSVAINMYLFGFLFLSGACLAQGGYTVSIFWLSFYVSCFFIPAQLLHELAHAEEDGRLPSIKKNNRLYLAGLVISVGFLIIFSWYLSGRFSLGRYFLAVNFLWIFLISYLLKTRIWREFSVSLAKELRLCFRIIGCMFGLFYSLFFLLR